MPKAKQTLAGEIPKKRAPNAKALREDLQKRKSALEKMGWSFNLTEDENGDIIGEKHFKYDEKPVRFYREGVEKVGLLFKACEEHQSDMDSLGFGKNRDQGKPKTKPKTELENAKAEYDKNPTSDNLSDYARKLEKYSTAEMLGEDSPDISTDTDTVAVIPLEKIAPSPFEPQERRRKKFTNEELSELANSIKEQGLISPITVRASKEQTGKFEVICGERRVLASRIAGSVSVLSVVRDLSDEAALEIQFQENLQRKDIDPLEEAYSYQYLLDHSKMTVTDLSIKFGKQEKFIKQRLKLNLLIPEVLEDIAAGLLPLGHAMEIAKLSPEVQKEALPLCYGKHWQNGDYVPDKNDVQSLSEFRSDLQGEIFLSLKSAIFSTKATNLRDDALACVKCPERTGAKGNLFEEFHDVKNDRCLNSVCYHGKTARFIQIMRDEKSAEIVSLGKVPPDYKIPIICWIGSSRQKIEEMFGECPLIDGEYQRIYENSKRCDFIEPGIFVDKTQYFGNVIEICRTTACTIHKSFSSSVSGNGTGEKTPAEKAAFYKRKQEIFDVKVGEAVRLKVLAEAAKSFSADRWVFEDEKWRIFLLARLWARIDENARTVIHEALGKKKYSIEYHFLSEKTALEYFTTKLTEDERSRMLFLCIIANEGEMLYGNWKSQDRIIAIAEEFKVDYKKLDAAERLEKAPKKYLEMAKQYSDAVTRGENPAKPVFYKLEEK